MKDYTDLADSLWGIMNECEGHRYGQKDYDITLDHIYEVVAHVREELLR
jgi:hypothetical protein